MIDDDESGAWAVWEIGYLCYIWALIGTAAQYVMPAQAYLYAASIPK